ncbi:MAG TPA: hypothetical protein VGM74_13225 [Burkholderiaceae bacterium]|jgi:membrane protein DedA with SNARE-associated domain
MADAATIKRLQTWVWVLVYAGTLLVGIGLTARRSDSGTGAIVIWIGAVLIAAGALLVWIRSRIRTDTRAETSPPKRPAP